MNHACLGWALSSMFADILNLPIMKHRMMLRILTFSLLCSLLPCCNKQGSAYVQKNDQDSEAPNLRRIKHSDRERAEDKPVAHRTRFETIDREDAAMRERILADITWNTIETDPALAHEAFQKLTAGSPEKICLIQHYALRLAEQDAEEALLWAEGLSTEHEIAAAKYHVALALAEADPERAANMLSESGIAGRDFDVALVQVIQSWANKSAPDAAAWVSMFPPGPAREASVQAIAQRWMTSDSPAVFHWLESTKDSALRQETARAIAEVIDQQPPQTQADWLKQASQSVRNELQAIRE